jgi:hypothetical protein
MTTAPKVFAIHENPEWFGPFAAALDARGVPYEEWLLTDGVLEIDEAPPEGIFWSRISASAHTRDHALSKDYTRALMSWLEAHGRRTVNGRRTIELEVSKVDQLTALRAAGIEVPRTRAVIGSHRIVGTCRRPSSRSTTRAARASASGASTASRSWPPTWTGPTSRSRRTGSRCCRSSSRPRRRA